MASKILLMAITSSYLHSIGKDYEYDPEIIDMVAKEGYYVLTDKKTD